jgi:soluble lytic murein transglycosylase-like protein
MRRRYNIGDFNFLRYAGGGGRGPNKIPGPPAGPYPGQSSNPEVRHHAQQAHSEGVPTQVPYNPPQTAGGSSTPPTPTSSPRSPAPTRSSPNVNSLAGKYLFHELADLISPGPTAQETAQAALRLGVKPKAQGDEGGSDPLKAALDAVKSATEDVAHGVSQATQQGAHAVESLPKQRPATFQGHPTLGNPTVAQLVKAGLRGKLQVNKGGKLTTPPDRRAARQLKEARQLYAKTARPDLRGLSPAERAVVPYVLKAHRKYPDIPVSVLMAQIRQESGFQPVNESSAGAEGLSQFIPSTAASYGVKYGAGRREQQSQVTGQAHYLHDLGFAGDPQSALSSYSGGYAASDYNNPVLQGAADYRALDRPTQVPQRVLAALKQAKGKAANLGIPTKAGDTEPGPQPKTVFVRADAKGFVDWAKALLGTQEGSRLQLKWAGQSGISAADPWCAAFIAAGIARRGLTPPPGAANSQSWMTWNQGTNIGTDIRKAKPGDIIVIGQGDHIGLYTGGGNMIAGNWSDEVAEYPVASDSRGVEGIIRPHFKGGKVAVQESTALPGAAIGPSGEIVSGPAGTGAVASSTAAPPAQQQFASGRSAVSLSPSLLTAATLPAYYRLFQQGGEAPSLSPEGEGGGTIERLLRRRRV